MDGAKYQRPEATDQHGGIPSAVAHDINNSLEAISDTIYLMQREPHLTEGGRRYLKLTLDEIRRLVMFIRDNQGTDHAAAVRQQTDIPGLLREIIDLYRAHFDARHIAIETRFCRDGDIAVFPRPLRRAFSNILLNAGDAVSPGGRIQVRVCRAHEWSGDKRCGVRVSFADNGCGVSADDLPKIFEPFFSTKGSRGTGMGLSIVKDAVDQQGGVLRVRSTTRPGGSGSVFTMFLPAAS